MRRIEKRDPGWAKQRRPRPTSHAQLTGYSCVIVSGFRAALDLNIYPLSNLIRPRCTERAKPGRGKPGLIMNISFFACFRAISPERSGFSKIATLFSCPCSTEVVGIGSSRIVADKQTHYCNPRCACAPRVNNYVPPSLSLCTRLWTYL